MLSAAAPLGLIGATAVGSTAAEARALYDAAAALLAGTRQADAA